MNNLPEENSLANGTSLHERRRNPHRTTRDQLAIVRAHALGRASCGGRTFSSRILSWALLFVPACAALGNAVSRLHLFADGERQHQRRGSQFHSQPVLPFQNSESLIRNQAINSQLFFAADVRRC